MCRHTLTVLEKGQLMHANGAPVTFFHSDGDFTVWRDDFTDGAELLRTVAVAYSRGGDPLFIPVDIAVSLAEQIMSAAANFNAA